MRLLYESSEIPSQAVIKGYSKGNYRDFIISEISKGKVELEKIVEFLVKNKVKNSLENVVISREKILEKLEVLKGEKRKIFSKIAKNQNKIFHKTLHSMEKKVYLSNKKS